MLFWQYEEELTAVLYGVAEISQFNRQQGNESWRSPQFLAFLYIAWTADLKVFDPKLTTNKLNIARHQGHYKYPSLEHPIA